MILPFVGHFYKIFNRISAFDAFLAQPTGSNFALFVKYYKMTVIL